MNYVVTSVDKAYGPFDTSEQAARFAEQSGLTYSYNNVAELIPGELDEPDHTFKVGDEVYIEWAGQWCGPGKVIGVDGWVVEVNSSVAYGWPYSTIDGPVPVRVHARRVTYPVMRKTAPQVK